MKPAVFFDRDGTLIEHVHHLTDPLQVRVIVGAGTALSKLREVGFACIVVTNQSVIGRGLLTVEGLERIHGVMRSQLLRDGGELDGVYFCPVAPSVICQRTVEHRDRKPGPGMLLRAAEDFSLDLGQSWIVGDSLSDMLAGRNAGHLTTILVRTGQGRLVDATDSAIDHVAESVSEAARLIRRSAAEKMSRTTGLKCWCEQERQCE